jgi:hypothetical protein
MTILWCVLGSAPVIGSVSYVVGYQLGRRIGYRLGWADHRDGRGHEYGAVQAR